MIDQYLTINEQVGIQNALWASMASLVAIVFSVFLWRTRKVIGSAAMDIARELAKGITVGAVCTEIHRTYWWIWRYWKSHGEVEAAQAMVYAADILWVPIGGILLGYAWHLRSRLRTVFGGIWWVPVILWLATSVIITLWTYGDV